METLEKTCMKHGVLKPEEIIKHKDPRFKLGYSIRCRFCCNEKKWRFEAKTCKKHGKLKSEDRDSQGRCGFCVTEWNSAYKKKNRAHVNARIAQDKLNNPEKWKKIYAEEYKRKRAKHGKQVVINEILRLKNITQNDYNRMFIEQDSKCKICGQTETRKGRTPGTIAKLVVDHCHQTNKVRGLLCHACNLMIGYSKDDTDILHMAIIYLEECK